MIGPKRITPLKGRKVVPKLVINVDYARFAAKEAAIKAHSHRRLTFHDVVIERRGSNKGEQRLGSGPPVARIKGEGEGEADADVSAMISISHDGDYATAVCMAHDPSVGVEGEEGEEDDDDIVRRWNMGEVV